MRRALTLFILIVLALGSSAAQAVACAMPAWEQPTPMAGHEDCPMATPRPAQNMAVAECFDGNGLSSAQAPLPKVMACGDHAPSLTVAVVPAPARQPVAPAGVEPPPRPELWRAVDLAFIGRFLI